MPKQNPGNQLDMLAQLDNNCEFCQVVRKQVPSFTVFEDEVSLAFLDKRPVFPGHCLLIPKTHYSTLLDLPDNAILPLFRNAKLLAQAVEIALEAEGTFVAINNRVSQSVPHLHIHVVPRRKKDGLKGFFWPRQPYKSQEETTRIQEAIVASLKQLQHL